MALSIPDQPTFVTASEREVWQYLRRQLGDDCVLLANFRISVWLAPLNGGVL